MRRTWLKQLPSVGSDIGYFFAFPSSTKPNAEDLAYGDFIILNGTDRVHPRAEWMEQTLRYADQHFEFHYFVKIEEDTFFNPWALVDATSDAFDRSNAEQYHENNNNNNNDDRPQSTATAFAPDERWSRTLLYTGRCWGNMAMDVIADPNHPYAKGGHFEPHYRDSKFYPPFCVSAGFVLSHDLVHFIVHSPRPLRRLTDEDTSIGLWLAAVEHARAREDRRRFSLVDQVVNFRPDLVPNVLFDNVDQYVTLISLPNATHYMMYWKQLLKLKNVKSE
jgi:hypothetical protein